jgi:translocation and assembly module TamB
MQWKRIAVRTIGVLGAVLVIVGVAGYFYLRSSGFERFAIRKIVEQADQATGGRTQIGSLDFSLGKLTARLHNVVIRGTEPPGAPPLLQLDQLTVSLKIQSVLHRKINLSELLIDHPVANLQVDPDGKSNLPQPPHSQSSGSTNLFDLAVGHVALTRGQVNYRDRKIPLDADLYDLGTDITFESLAKRYRGSIAYDNGQIHYGQYAPLPHNLTAKFRVTPSLFSLDSAVIKIASSTATFHASLANYSDPSISGEGDYDLRLNTQDLAAMSPQVKTAGEIVLSGKLHYEGGTNQPLLRSITADGRIESNDLLASSSSGRVDLRNLQGRYQFANGAFQANHVEAELLNGRVSVNVDIQNLDKAPISRVQAALHRISLQAAQQALRSPDLNRLAIAGNLEGTADASWSGSIGNLRGRADLTVRSAENPASRVANNVPLDGTIHAKYDGPTGTLSVHQTTLRIPSTTVNAEGQISKHSSLAIRVASSDLHRLVGLASVFHSTANLPSISGAADLDATVQGSTERPQISGHLSAQNLKVQGSEWKSAQLSLQADPSRIIISKGTLQNAQRGEASFGGSVSLHNWSYLPSNPIQANLSLRQMSLADLQHLANLRYPVSGELSANVSVKGSQLNPSGSGSLQVANARVYDEPFQTLALQFHTDGNSIVSKLNIATDAGSADTDFTFTPKTKVYKFRLDAPAIVLQKLHSIEEKNLAVNGIVAISASGQGTFDDPQLTASIQLPKLEVRQKSLVGLKAELVVAHERADFTLDSQVAQASVRARGQVSLTGEYEAEASIDTATIPLGALFATYGTGVPEGFQGQTELHATLKGPLKDRSRLEAHLTIPVLNASYESLHIAAAGPIHADYIHSTLTLQPAEIRRADTSIRLQGSMPLQGAIAPTLTAQGTIDTRILSIVSPDVHSSGIVALDIRTSGSGASPQIEGQVHLQNISMATADAPLSVDKLNGTLDLGNDSVHLSNVTAQVGDGQLSVGGSIRYRPSLQFDVALRGQAIRLRYPEGLRSVLDSNLTWTGTSQNSALAGRVLIDSLSFTPDFDLASFGDQFSSNAATPATPGFADTIGLQIRVQSTGNLSAVASQVSLEGSADLQVIGTAANPVITGRTSLTGGELFYRNVRYQLQRGVITFADPNETRPVLNVSVSTTVEQYNLTLNLRGPFDQLTTSYVSDPPLATADIINLIARGKTSSELASSSPSTDSMIASQAASQISSSVQKLAGISSLQIDPLLGGNTQNPSARLALQQRLTKNFLFTFSTDVTQPGQEIVQGDYQINKHWSVSVERDQLGGVSVDGRFHTRF